LPFYHLKSEGFWTLQTKAGQEILLTKSFSIRSFSQLKEAVAYASFSEDLYALLQDAGNRVLLIDMLIQTYLGAPGNQYADRSIIREVERQMLHEPTAVYREEVGRADEEELFIRSGVFKRLIPRIYNYTCCISNMRIIASREVQMVDACHIVPFAVSHDDTVCNGLSLCPNLHRAFDRGLIAVDEDYRVIVSRDFSEGDSDYLIRKYEGSLIVLPAVKEHYPAREHLKWH